MTLYPKKTINTHDKSCACALISTQHVPINILGYDLLNLMFKDCLYLILFQKRIYNFLKHRVSPIN